MERPEILKEILEEKRRELSLLEKEESIAELKARIRDLEPARDFKGALVKYAVNIIAEVKKASPSKGIIRDDFDPVEVALEYERNGACAVSVLTDRKYFMGSLDNLVRVKAATLLPVLRKDFVIDPYQIYESRAAGADAVLLIVAALEKSVLDDLLGLCGTLCITPLVEVHTEEELDTALEAGSEVIGINNRDLNTFVTDLSTTVRLAKKIPGDRIVVSESGINTPDDVRILRDAGVNAFLVGEALVRESDIGTKLKELRGVA